MKDEITITETDDNILPPPDGNILLTKNGVLVMTIETFMRTTDVRATEGLMQMLELRSVMARRRKR